MSTSKIDQLIINSPYEEPQWHWKYNREKKLHEKIAGRRPAGYIVATENSRGFDDPGRFIEIELVNKIRPRVKEWKESGYTGVTGITKRLLEHWYNLEERTQRRFFFAQLEAIETLIWLFEAPESDKVGIQLQSDGGEFKRLCSKLATGTGKTIVMAMLIAWQILNKVTYAQDRRFAKNVFIVAPGRTIRERLQVLIPDHPQNYYDEFNIIPAGLIEKLRQGKVLIRNWQALQWDTEEKLAKRKTVDKRGAKSNEAYVKEILGEMANAHNLLVINDEAHHAWRVAAESKAKKLSAEEIEATRWIGALDRIHKARGILTCFDFSATPFIPTGKKSSEEALFKWIVSDFGLNDAIESGLVKTPRVVVRDDGVPNAKDYKSRLFHLYLDEEVKDDLSRKAEEHEPLPDLVQNAYYLLGKDWLATYENWNKSNQPVPPVMITVANRTETAARIKYAFDNRKIRIDELCCSDKTLHIDSKVLEDAESMESTLDYSSDNDQTVEEFDSQQGRSLSKKEQAELLRKKVDTVGQIGKPGQNIQNVISVGMLSEGWDAKTVTHIMGLRAFSSQLLCEQVVGRGLRRTTYEVSEETGLFEAEYVNIFGVPFTFLPHEDPGDMIPSPPKPKTCIEPDPSKEDYKISWPNILRIDNVYKPQLSLDLEHVRPLLLDPVQTIKLAELAPVVEGKPDTSQISEIELQELAKRNRMQKIIFETSKDLYDQMKPSWRGSKELLLSQILGLVEQFIDSGKIQITQLLFYQDTLRRRLLYTLNMNKIVQHMWEAIRCENTESLEAVFDKDHPIRSTGDMKSWYSTKPCERTLKSHINFCVYDSTWESSDAFILDKHPEIISWVKNDHLGFDIYYIHRGIIRKYRPDFIVKLSHDRYLILETKGQDTEQDKAKRHSLQEWIKAVNNMESFGNWQFALCSRPRELNDILEKL